ncbi:DUF3365 domain-containing protein [Dokdonella sp.]|uniref:Tll0287-like domain-containing protein n=1 Tax=Dokdonella sp. TaxID=2291710 RepID=UPI002DD65686|nr:DUF3365 domain-containing protein [Dokdonella sp.]
MIAFKKLPLSYQFAILLFGLACIAALSGYLIGSSVYVSETRNQARTVADMVDNFGQWATRYRGVWVKDDPRDPRLEVGSFLEREASSMQGGDSTTAPNAAAFHRKNPALVQRELSDITMASPAKAKFRMTSDRFMNPNNAPSEFDKVAMGVIRESGASEYSEVRGVQLLYARRLIADKGCLKCHGAPASAPAAVTALYPGPQGYGYEEGKLAGVISVAIPLEFSFAGFIQRFDAQVWAALAAVGLGVVGLLVFIRQQVIVPVRSVRAFALAASSSEPGAKVEKVDFIEGEHTSANEIHELNTAVKAMHTSIDYLYRKMIKR